MSLPDPGVVKGRDRGLGELGIGGGEGRWRAERELGTDILHVHERLLDKRTKHATLEFHILDRRGLPALALVIRRCRTGGELERPGVADALGPSGGRVPARRVGRARSLLANHRLRPVDDILLRLGNKKGH